MRGAEVAEYGSLTRLVIERTAECEALLPVADRRQRSLGVVRIDASAAHAVRLQPFRPLIGGPVGEPLDLTHQKRIRPRLCVCRCQHLRQPEKSHAFQRIVRADRQLE